MFLLKATFLLSVNTYCFQHWTVSANFYVSAKERKEVIDFFVLITDKTASFLKSLSLVCFVVALYYSIKALNRSGNIC